MGSRTYGGDFDVRHDEHLNARGCREVGPASVAVVIASI